MDSRNLHSRFRLDGDASARRTLVWSVVLGCAHQAGELNQRPGGQKMTIRKWQVLLSPLDRRVSVWEQENCLVSPWVCMLRYALMANVAMLDADDVDGPKPPRRLLRGGWLGHASRSEFKTARELVATAKALSWPCEITS